MMVAKQLQAMNILVMDQWLYFQLNTFALLYHITRLCRHNHDNCGV